MYNFFDKFSHAYAYHRANFTKLIFATLLYISLPHCSINWVYQRATGENKTILRELSKSYDRFLLFAFTFT